MGQISIGAKKLSLKSLELIADNIVIKTAAFSKDSFFKEKGQEKLYFGSNFISWILRAMPDDIPAFECVLLKTQLMKYVYDYEILDELGQPKPFTISEFSAIVHEMLQKQLNGESGTLLNNGFANVFFIQLENGRIVAMDLDWGSVRCGWCLDARVLGDSGSFDGFCIFSRN